MVLATLPPSIEIREFTRTTPVSFAAEPFWAQSGISRVLESSWKAVAFSRIAALEQGKNIPGAGDFRASEQAAGKLRLYVDKISIQSLPIPQVVPLSGSGTLLVWKSGSKAVEITAFADGEIVPEAFENREPNEQFSQSDPQTLVEWLVKAPEIQRPHATTR